eukprot:762167-Hanusia_phi.AAC.1
MIRSQLGVSCVQSCRTCPPEDKEDSVSEEEVREAHGHLVRHMKSALARQEFLATLGAQQTLLRCIKACLVRQQQISRLSDTTTQDSDAERETGCCLLPSDPDEHRGSPEVEQDLGFSRTSSAPEPRHLDPLFLMQANELANKHVKGKLSRSSTKAEILTDSTHHFTHGAPMARLRGNIRAHPLLTRSKRALNRILSETNQEEKASRRMSECRLMSLQPGAFREGEMAVIRQNQRAEHLAGNWAHPTTLMLQKAPGKPLVTASRILPHVPLKAQHQQQAVTRDSLFQVSGSSLSSSVLRMSRPHAPRGEKLSLFANPADSRATVIPGFPRRYSVE